MSKLQQSLRTEIVIIAAVTLVTLTLLILTLTGVSSFRAARVLARTEAQSIAEEYGKKVRAELDQAVEMGKTLGAVLEANSGANQISREQAYQLIKAVHTAHPSFQGVYSYCEPMSFDHRDQAEGEPFQYWVYSEKGAQTVAPFYPYEPAWGGEEWYTLPQASGKAELLEPYIDVDLSIPMISVSTPLMNENRFIGMVGIDLTIEYMQKITDNAVIYNNKGSMAIVTALGSVCALTGGVRPIDDGDEQRFPTLSEQFSLGDSIYTHLQEGTTFTGESKGIATFFVPLNISGLSSWGVLIQVPTSHIYAPAQKMIFTLVLIAILIAIPSFILFSRRLTRIIKPLERVVSQCGNVSRGNLSQDMSSHDLSLKNEVGALANSFQAVITSLREKVAFSKQVAQGKLNIDITPASSEDELGLALKEMKDSLLSMVSTITELVQVLRTGTLEISSTGQALATEATDSAASVEEINSALNQIHDQVKDTAQKASEIDKKAVESSNDATLCNTQMQELTNAMSEIARETNLISKIIKTIDDIAFQTNLLALNAAVEAARAGSHGKGFAVVADEVRNLANRSAKAAAETSSLITNGLTQVNRGKELTDVTAGELQTIVDKTVEISSLITGMTSVVEEQAIGISQISEGLTQIESATQNTTAHAEETASAIQEMEGVTKRLTHLISRFTIDEQSAPGKVQEQNNSSLPIEKSRRSSHPIQSNSDDYGSY